MADQAMCACMRVGYKPIDNGDGSMSERWVCSAGCGTEFVRKVPLFDRALSAQKRPGNTFTLDRNDFAQMLAALLRSRPTLADPDVLALVERIDELHAKATPGPWMAYSYEGNTEQYHRYSVCIDAERSEHRCVLQIRDRTEGQAELTAHFLAELRNAWPQLAAALRGRTK